ncbi:DNA ligase [Streptomyces sp. NPDC048448]|uniref:ATP-dependent DNA ligase n=1 Tax=Streptomyces sp. NPDC048448 TaxID=3365554 RepID=UPI00371F5FC4
MDWPVSVALAQPVPALPTGTGWVFEMKVDGHRTLMWRTDGGVRLQARSGRDVTAVWGDLALAGLPLPTGTVLDGEAVIATEDGRISFEAAQARAASSPSRARLLASRRPAHYIVWDALQLPPPFGDVRARPYRERRAALLDVLSGLPANSPIQAVSATSDRHTALTWYNTLQDQGVEGLVAKRAASPYRADRSGAWQKIRHAETVDADVVGYTGPASRPRTLAVQLPDGRIALTQRLATPLAARIGPLLAAVGPGPTGHSSAGQPYTAVPHGIAVVEIAAGTTRHAVVTATRLRGR